MSERNVQGVRHHQKYSMSEYRDESGKGPEKRKNLSELPSGEVVISVPQA